MYQAAECSAEPDLEFCRSKHRNALLVKVIFKLIFELIVEYYVT